MPVIRCLTESYKLLDRSNVLKNSGLQRIIPFTDLSNPSQQFDCNDLYFADSLAKKQFLSTSTGLSRVGMKIVTSLSSGIEIVNLSGGVRALVFTKDLPGISAPVSNVIFEREFYNDLLSSIRSIEKVVLLSNPGVSKSVFHFYYLARLFNPKAIGQLPPNYWGSLEHPSVVIRHVANKEEMQVYFIKEKLCFVSPSKYETLEYFDPRTTIYLYEPLDSLEGPFYADQTLQILATMSLNPVRYHEFCKNNGLKLFMPLYKKVELLAIADYIRNRPVVTAELQNFLSEESVIQRFNEFGGIIRHVLFSTTEILKEVRLTVEEAIKDCNAYTLLNSSNIENSSVSHFLMQYDVQRRGPGAFKGRKVVFTSEDMERRLQSKVSLIDLSSMRQLLLTVDAKQSTLATDASARIYFQSLVYMSLVSPSGVKWQSRSNTRQAPWNICSISLQSSIESNAPTLQQMKQGVLYYPTLCTFPWVEMYYLEDAVTVVTVQVTFGTSKNTRTFTRNQYFLFLLKLGLVKDVKNVTGEEKIILKGLRIKFILVPHPSLADEYNVIDESNMLQHLDILIWKVPSNYSLECT